jgi:hypothetical protein
LAQDPNLAGQLRLQATEHVVVSAQVFGRSQVELAEVGWFDQRSGQLLREPRFPADEGRGVHRRTPGSVLADAMG